MSSLDEIIKMNSCMQESLFGQISLRNGTKDGR